VDVSGSAHGLTEAVRGVARGTGHVVAALPFSQAYQGAAEVLRGEPAVGSLRQLVLLAASGAFLALVAAMHVVLADGASDGRRWRTERPWSTRSPVFALARVYQGSVLRSREGRVAVLVPLVVSACLGISVVALAELRARMAAGPLPWPLGIVASWAGLPLVGIFLAILPALDDRWLNQFGPDGPALRGLLLLPLRPEQILLGRTLGMLGLCALAAVLAIGPLLMLCGPAPAELAWGLAACGFVFLVTAGCGHVISARFPRRVQGGLLRSGATPLVAFVIPPSVQLPAFALVVLAYKASAPLGAWGPALGLWLLLGATAVAYWRALPSLGSCLMALRDHLVEELG
jgi:hypothetical protein